MIGFGGCLDINENQYSWFWSSATDVSRLKKECESTENCVGVEYGEWPSKGLILVDSNGSGKHTLVYDDIGSGPIESSNPSFNAMAACYAYNCQIGEFF